MTAEPHPHPKYTLTEEEIECVETALKSDEHCKKCPYEGGGFNQGVISFLRSHPVHQQSEQEIREKVLCDLSNELDELDCMGDVCCRDYLRNYIREKFGYEHLKYQIELRSKHVLRR